MALGGRGPEASSRTRRVVVAAAVALFAGLTFVLGLWVGGNDEYKQLLPRGAGLRGAADPASIYRTVHDAVCPPVHCPEHEDRALSVGTADEDGSEEVGPFKLLKIVCRCCSPRHARRALHALMAPAPAASNAL